MEMERKNNKIRPSKTSRLPTPTKPSTNRRSTRRNPNSTNFNESDDEDDERKKKKVKLVVRLPQSDDKIGQKSQSDESSYGSGSESGPDLEDQEINAKKRRISDADDGSNEAVSDQEKKLLKEETDNSNVSPLKCFVKTPLPDNKLLVFILQRLQKKDTRGAFSKPVDLDELPDYHEIIEQPMDFGTVNKKLVSGAYKSLEELEADVLLICSNAMEYNSSGSIYHRQARSIQELAKRDFENLRHERDDGQPQPKVVRRGRPPGKNQKKVIQMSPSDRVVPEVSSGVALANRECQTTGSDSYNLRKAPPLYSDPFVSSCRSRNGENGSESSPVNWNDEFPASILRADTKYGKKHFTVDENRRDTYGLFHPTSFGYETHVLSSSTGVVKWLVPVGLQEPLAYARSLARYAANLGSVAWKIASKKIEFISPAGVQYGHDRVGENGAPLNPSPFSSEKQKSSNSNAGDCSSRKITIPTSDLSSAVASEGTVEAVNSRNELPVQGDTSSWRMQSQDQQKSLNQPIRNGCTGKFGYSLTSEMIPGNSPKERVAFPSQMAETMPRNDRIMPEETGFSENWSTFRPEYPKAQGKPSWYALPVQQRHNLSVPPELDVQIPTVSPSSSLRIGSPQQQPDLVLQL